MTLKWASSFWCEGLAQDVFFWRKFLCGVTSFWRGFWGGGVKKVCYNVIMVKTSSSKQADRVAKKAAVVADPKRKKVAQQKTARAEKKDEKRADAAKVVDAKSNDVAELPHRAMPAILRVAASFLILVVFAGIFTWYVLWRQNAGDADATMRFMREKPILAGYSYVIILLTMCVIAAVTWKPFVTVGVSFALCSIVMYINAQKIFYRDMPLLPEDFLMVDQAGTIASFVDVWSVVRLVIGVVLVVIGSGILEYGASRIFGHGGLGREAKRRAWWERHSIIPRVVWTAIAVAALLMFARPVLHFDDKNSADGENDAEWIEGLEFSYWNQKADFAANGYIISFLYNLGGLKETEPEGYSEETIAKVAEKYEDAEGGTYADLAEAVDNVIVILDESFMDPDALGEPYEYHGDEELLPNLRKIFEKYPSGYMYSPSYGGGTANVEFEVLTSLSNYWAQTSPYVTSLSKVNHVPGVARYAADSDFTTTAIHPFDGSMYKRSAVYNRMGIETFYDQSTMKHTEHENGQGYISDGEAYSEVLDVLGDGEERHFVMLATMQNHAPYNAAKYDELEFQQSGVNHPYEISSYYESIHRGDEYLGEFIEALDKLEERTLVLWFGDHVPGLLSDFMLTEDGGLHDKAHLTPYFIYTNFDTDQIYTEEKVAKMNARAGFKFKEDGGVDLPTVTPNCLVSEVYRLLDVKMPPLVYLASKVCNETPVLANEYSRASEIEDTEVLRDYRLVNYDILSGKRYWLGL